jgi:hypothetical protein
MAALAFFGYLFLGVGPGIVFWLYFIAPKSFLVLLSITRYVRALAFLVMLPNTAIAGPRHFLAKHV